MSEPRRLEAVVTPVKTAEVIAALWHAWRSYWGTSPPKRESIQLLAAQWALETGWGKSCMCYNLGNVRGSTTDGCCWQFYKCNELLPIDQATRLVQVGRGLVYITSEVGDKVWTWFVPDHPGSRFRAFESLEAGALDYMTIMMRRFSASLLP